MERRTLGRTDMRVSVLGFGGSEIGYEGVSAGVVTRLLNAALDAGLNVIDTAECYEDSEALIGGGVAGRRAEYYLFTKCGHPRGFGAGDWRPASLLASIQRSLTRLRTDHVDLVQLHSCSEAELLRGEVIVALEQARERGYTRYIGYSGDGAAARHAIECGRFDTLQTSVSIADQEALDLTLPLARRRNLGVIAKRPLANAAWRTGRKPASAYHHAYWERLRRLDYDFIKADPVAAVGTALRFTVGISGVHTAIVGTTNPDRWQQNAALLAAGPLSKPEVARIRARWKDIAPPHWTGQT
ncbi:MAG TPA: aldo/keto reductase [Candidatus Limnocylindria bacterium]|nr:aldo/keto reductase [Candidatus Limnocylindria bacterium]